MLRKWKARPKKGGGINQNRLERAKVEAQEAQKRMLSMAELELKNKALRQSSPL